MEAGDAAEGLPADRGAQVPGAFDALIDRFKSSQFKNNYFAEM